MGCCGRCLKHKATRCILRLLFSNWGLCFIVTIYIIIGAFIFIGIEADGENERKKDLVATAQALDVARQRLIDQLKNESTYRSADVLWQSSIKTSLDSYQALFADAILNHSYSGTTPGSASELFHGWSYASAILFTCETLASSLTD